MAFVKFSPPYKVLREKYKKMHTIFTWIETLFISLSFTKKLNFRPIILGNMDIKKIDI